MDELTWVRHNVPVRIDPTQPATQTLVGDLYHTGVCPPSVVQVLLAGATFSRSYWHPDPVRSYVTAAAAAGYAVFNADRVGTGSSSKPPSHRLDVTAGAVAVGDLISALRSGRVGGHGFDQIVLVGHSLGAAVGWLAGNAADALAVTSELHAINHPYWARVRLHQARNDPRFAGLGLDTGYLTTEPGTRRLFHDGPSGPATAAGEAGKDLTTAAEMGEATELVDSPDPRNTPSRALTVPVLVAVGEHDPFFCRAGSTEAGIRAQEQPYYTRAASVEVMVLPGMGHCLMLHRDPTPAHRVLLDWAARTVPARTRA